MAGLRRKRGSMLIDVMFTVLILGAVGTIFSAVLPTAIKSSNQAREYKIATAIAQRKMEQLRTMNYQSLTQPHLSAALVIDPEPVYSPYHFTSVDEKLTSQLPHCTGTLRVDDDNVGDTREVQIIVTWDGPQGTGTRSVRLDSIFADRRTRAVN